MLEKDGFAKNVFGKFSQVYSVKYFPAVLLKCSTSTSLIARNYDIEYIRREFLGESANRCFIVKPKTRQPRQVPRTHLAEDQDFHIRSSQRVLRSIDSTKMFFHFDSWLNDTWARRMAARVRLHEESNVSYLMGTANCVSKVRRGFGVMTSVSPSP
jgi:hypothetical protein